ncbi:MAG: 3-oxoacyl-ACP reductase FabG [Lachnospiraceae bacterium]|nr:3-oxoacyl-ACP reductase FabG [Lachnospiraceae bacterium]
MKNLTDKIVFITGAARGLGYGMAEAFAREGSKIIIADIQEELASEAAARLAEKYKVEVTAYGIDVTDVASIKQVFNLIKERYGKLDVMVNNAGIQIRCASKEFQEKDWDKLMGVNLKGPFFCSQQAALLMERDGGAIVNISSGTSTRTTPGRAPYVISKGGINSLTAVLASEWAEDRNGKKAIRVNAVAPGWIETEMVKDGFRLGVVSEKQILAAVPFKRLADPEEIAKAVVFLASDEASYITGQTLYVDGGWSALGMPDLSVCQEK